MRQTICDAITFGRQCIDSINDKIDWLTEDLHICFFVIKALMASDLDIAAICVDARFHYRGLGLAYRIKLRHDLTIQVAGGYSIPIHQDQLSYAAAGKRFGAIGADLRLRPARARSFV